jgi:hypothetical protein
MTTVTWPAGEPGQPPDDAPRVPRFFAEPQGLTTSISEQPELAARFEHVVSVERKVEALAARVAVLELQVKDLREPPFQPILP